MRTLELQHRDAWVRQFWNACRSMGVPGELHGGKHRRPYVATALALCCDLVHSDDRSYFAAYETVFKWLTIGSRAATIGCVRSAVYGAFDAWNEWCPERAGLTLVLFAGDWNTKYPYFTAYDDAYLRAVRTLEPLGDAFEINVKLYLGDQT